MRLHGLEVIEHSLGAALKEASVFLLLALVLVCFSLGIFVDLWACWTLECHLFKFMPDLAQDFA